VFSRWTESQVWVNLSKRVEDIGCRLIPEGLSHQCEQIHKEASLEGSNGFHGLVCVNSLISLDGRPYFSSSENLI
jgi:hypothetical protein